VSLSNECLFLLLFISVSTQSGNFWLHPRMFLPHGYDQGNLYTVKVIDIFIAFTDMRSNPLGRLLD
jgi:hypothetical protein